MAAPGGRRARWSGALRSTWFKVGAAVVAAGALVAGAFIAGGYDVDQAKVDDGSVWALQTGQGERYARVDTALGQLDTVKSITSPSDLVQANGHVLLYSQSDTKVASVNLAQPATYDTTTSSSSPFVETPSGTVTVVHTGDYLGYLSNTGAVHAARVEDDGKNTQAVAAPGSGGKSAFSADTIAIGTDGMLYAYSHTTRSVLRYDVKTGRTVGTDAVAGGPDRPGASLTAVGSSWVLLAPGGGSLWIRGVKGAIDTKLDGKAVLQQPSAKKPVVAVASSSQLATFTLKDGAPKIVERGQSGVAAAPVWNGTKLYAAWVQTGSAPGSLWSGRLDMSGVVKGSAKDLDNGSREGQASTLQQTATPVFRSNGGAEILNDTTSGWVWSVPSAKIVQGSQDWDLNQKEQSAPENQTQQTERETDPKPPVAVADKFGVRAGSLVSLPVILNDYDPNGDVVSIVPGSLAGLNTAFGQASIANNAQSITVQVEPGASGTATFQYTLTDGTAGGGGLKSKPATVTLTVSPSGTNAAPVWCNGATGNACLYNWPNGVKVAPGGSVEIPVLRGWVDPDGDPMFAQSAAGGADYTVSVSPDGTLVFQAAPTAQQRTVTIPVTISDVNGATAEKNLQVVITGTPTLQVENFGLMTAAGVPITVDPSSHIRGAKGTAQIASATLATSNLQATDAGASTSSDEAKVTVDSSGSTFDFEAQQPGSYPVTMTISDSGAKSSTATATVRITVVPPDQPLLSTSPVTVFVRPQTDTSVDVFSAVQNPTGHVLLLSAPKPKPAAGASLDVDVVGQSQLRVRGTTGTGDAGLLGTVEYTVSDGTNTPSMTVKGVATVYLLPDQPPSRPVAINDSVTVRAGAQVDIPVLANDVGPNGDIVELDPSSIQNASHQGLAFASGQVLRYLAPETSPGTKPITLRYSAYSAGNPSAKSEATVTVNILTKEGDRPPQPQMLTGRVAAGASVRIPFDPYGVDPDGDMVALDRIISQPSDGTAQISADGTAIVFTALADSQGQQKFSYRVRDSEGETGEATVMVGVLNAQTDPAPVTFSDYVQVQAGAGNQVVVQPTANDVDPSGGELSLVDVTPDAPKDSSLYGVLKQNIKSKNASQVVITSTPNARTLTYTYSVKNAQGDVSAGLIVVDVVIGHVPDYPVAVDTVVDAQNRARLAQGIDVVAGKVSWGSGDISRLKLSLYKKTDGVSVDGDTISVSKVPSSGLLVPFELTGPDFTGQNVTTYGFLRVPALADVILALKADTKPFEVKEGDSRKIKLSDVVSVPPGSALDAQSGSIKTTKARKAASCSVDSSGQLTYDAGDGAPWADACLAPVRLVGQSEYTILAVPFQIIPKQPQPELRPASLTASPGQAAVRFNLTQMTSWLGHDDLSGLHFKVSYSGGLFSVTQSGQTVSVRANDTAQPGLEEVAHVTIAGYTGVGTAADITLKVGPAPSTRPAGGSVSLSCSEANGSSCSTAVVGRPDEVNAYRTPLKVVSVTPTVTGCTGVTFRVADGRTVEAKWGADTPGGRCTVPFVVQDAQGKRSASGSGDGSLSFELKGYPAAPAAVAQVAYGPDSVTLAVSPGDAASSYPALTGFKVYVDGKPSVTCDPNGACPPVNGLKNGDKHTFEVKSVNGVGESRGSVKTVGWAFAQPTVSGVTATPIFVQGQTSPTAGVFDVNIPNMDSTASSYTIQVGGDTETVPASGDVVTRRFSATPGQPVSVVVTPVSQFEQPPGDLVGATPDSVTVTPAGLPTFDSVGTPYSPSDSSIQVSPAAQGNPNGSAKSDAYLYFAAPPGNDPSCSNTGSNATINYAQPGGSDWAVSATPTLTGLNQFERYEVYVCYTNQFGAVQRDLGSIVVWDQSNAPVPDSNDCSYSITQQGAGLPDYEYGANAPSCSSRSPYKGYRLVISGSQTTFGTAPAFTARYCDLTQTFCGAAVAIHAAAGSAPFQMQVTGVTAACNVPESGATSVTVAPNNDRGVPQAGPSVTVSAYEYTTDGTTWQPGTGDGTALPAGTTQIRNIHYTITWGQSGFATYNGTSADPVSCSTN
ncbi:Ig-like domain-containing protein [Gryllotalpicola daejeonensis]|uniref:Ig-like domain-containing protein n=1 Tax=Gryllotalpicola daejeonensis TaxID=993087 RepID=A0ABP7ZJN6_9MICO